MYTNSKPHGVPMRDSHPQTLNPDKGKDAEHGGWGTNR